MATSWTAIPDSVLEPGKPARSIDAMALRDNPIAIAEGAAGAPRIKAPALNVGNAEFQWWAGNLPNAAAAHGDDHIVLRLNGDLAYKEHIYGGVGQPDTKITRRSIVARSAAVGGTYRFVCHVVRTSEGGSGQTRVAIYVNGGLQTASAWANTGNTPEVLDVSSAAGDAITVEVEEQGSSDRNRSIQLTDVIVTTTGNRGLLL